MKLFVVLFLSLPTFTSSLHVTHHPLTWMYCPFSIRFGKSQEFIGFCRFADELWKRSFDNNTNSTTIGRMSNEHTNSMVLHLNANFFFLDITFLSCRFERTADDPLNYLFSYYHYPIAATEELWWRHEEEFWLIFYHFPSWRRLPDIDNESPTQIGRVFIQTNAMDCLW